MELFLNSHSLIATHSRIYFAYLTGQVRHIPECELSPPYYTTGQFVLFCFCCCFITIKRGRASQRHNKLWLLEMTSLIIRKKNGYYNNSCVCGDSRCKSLQKTFQELMDERGSQYQVPRVNEESKKKGSIFEHNRNIRDKMIECLGLTPTFVGSTVKTRVFVAKVHYHPSVLREVLESFTTESGAKIKNVVSIDVLTQSGLWGEAYSEKDKATNDMCWIKPCYNLNCVESDIAKIKNIGCDASQLVPYQQSVARTPGDQPLESHDPMVPTANQSLMANQMMMGNHPNQMVNSTMARGNNHLNPMMVNPMIIIVQN